MLTLVYSPGSCALAPHIALEEAGATYDTKKISLRTDDQTKPEFLAINPKGKVPALITDRGILTENGPILVYLAQTFPKAKLAPIDDPFALAEVQAFNGYLATTVHVNFAHRTRGYRWADEESSKADMTRKAPQNVRESFQMIENTMMRGPYVMGDTYTIADLYLLSLSRWLPASGLSVAEFPKIDAMINRIMERPAVKKVVAIHAAG